MAEEECNSDLLDDAKVKLHDRLALFLEDENRISDDVLSGTDEIMERLSHVGSDLRQEGLSPLTVAAGLILRAKMLLFESEPVHVCEIFAYILRFESLKYPEEIADMFVEAPLRVVEDD